MHNNDFYFKKGQIKKKEYFLSHWCSGYSFQFLSVNTGTEQGPYWAFPDPTPMSSACLLCVEKL